MRSGHQQERLEKKISAGAGDYRAFVGPAELYDVMGAMQFNLLTFLGLREHHYLLDIGCGSLRVGRLFIPYLLKGRYYGIEPDKWLVQEGIENELGRDLVRIKQPVFSYDDNFALTVFDRQFDFIIAQSIFTHASQSQIRRCLSEAKKVMQSQAVFVANFIQGAQNYSGDEWVYPDAVTYTLERMISLAEEQDLVCYPIEWPQLKNRIWIVIVHPENPKNVLGLSDAAQLSFLENELRVCEERLVTLENHPYVRLGLRVNRLLRWIKDRLPIHS